MFSTMFNDNFILIAKLIFCATLIKKLIFVEFLDLKKWVVKSYKSIFFGKEKFLRSHPVHIYSDGMTLKCNFSFSSIFLQICYVNYILLIVISVTKCLNIRESQRLLERLLKLEKLFREIKRILKEWKMVTNL